MLAATSPGHLMVPGKLSVLLKMATPRRYKDPDYMKRIAGDIYGGALRRSPELVRRHLRHVRWSSDYGYYLQVAAGFMVPELSFYVLDEPFAGINPVIKDAIIDLILHANKTRGMTFLVVSHEMTVMRRLCHRITVMMEGRVAVEGTLDEVARRPEVIAGYLGKAWT